MACIISLDEGNALLKGECLNAHHAGFCSVSWRSFSFRLSCPSLEDLWNRNSSPPDATCGLFGTVPGLTLNRTVRQIVQKSGHDRRNAVAVELQYLGGAIVKPQSIHEGKVWAFHFTKKCRTWSYGFARMRNPTLCKKLMNHCPNHERTS